MDEGREQIRSTENEPPAEAARPEGAPRPASQIEPGLIGVALAAFAATADQRRRAAAAAELASGSAPGRGIHCGLGGASPVAM